jgi:2-polyprenyl-3-methyl-5-hydroxy-6-metoxy-1,4-benzoquinol methylase
MRPRSDTRLVWVGGRCVYGCATCPIDQASASAGSDAPALLRALHGGARRLVVLVGGEPFLRPDLMRLLAAVRAAGSVPGLVTTGRPLLYPDLRARLRGAGLGYLRIQLFGDGEVHDQVSAVAGSFTQAIEALRAWLAEEPLQCDIDVALTVRGRRLDTVAAELQRLADAVPRHPRVRIVLALDTAQDDPQDREGLERFLRVWNEDLSKPLLASEQADLAAVSIAAPRASDFVGAAPAACCLGTVQRLAQPAPALAPQETTANSFNFVRSEISVAATADAATCGAYRAAEGSDPWRQLWLVEGDRLVLHVSDTGDFSTTEIERVKDDWSHVFIDRAAPGVLDDFIEGMRRVVPDELCDGCAHRHTCGRRFRLVEGAPYAQQEAWIARHVANLRGRVLDVGCGEQLYRGVLAPMLRSGAVQYTGLDPDEPSLNVARAALPEGRFELGGIEDYRDEPQSYDHMLCLRSLNHVRDVDEALARMAVLLKPGGQLLIVECTPFAMLRSAEQVAAADRAPRAGHQHFRNVASDEVVPFAYARGLEVVEHQPAGFEGTNQWLLLLARR